MKTTFLKKNVLFVSCVSFVFPAFAETISVDGIFYNITSASTVEVTYRGAETYGEDGWMYYSEDELYCGEVTIPTTVTTETATYSVTAIGKDAFAGSKKMSKLNIPATVISIGNGAFSLCNALQSFVVAAENQTFFSENGILYSKSPVAIFYVPRAIQGDLVLNDAITEIPSSAFQNCSEITTVQIPENVVSINDGAFNLCTNLLEVFFNTNLKSIGVQAFSKCAKLEVVRFPESLSTIGESAFVDCSSLMYPLLKEGLKVIGKYAFYNCDNILGIMLPSTLQAIGEKAFDGCVSLSEIKNYSSLTLEKGSETNGCVAKYATSIENSELEITYDFSVEEPKSTCFYSETESRYQVYTFTLKNNMLDVDSLQWDFGNGKKSLVVRSSQMMQTYDAPGTYSVTLTVWKDNTKYLVTKENLITIYQAPNAKFSFAFPETKDWNVVPFDLFVVDETVKGDGELSYEWMLYRDSEKELVAKEFPFPYVITEEDWYSLQLTVRDEHGCSGVWVEYFYGRTQPIKGFEYIIPGSCHDAVGDKESLVSYKIENNNLILYGVVTRICGGTIETAEIIDLGDTIQIPTYSTTNGPVTDCICPFDFEITIPNLDRESCVVVFDGQIINIDKNVPVNVVDSKDITMWYSSLTNQVFVDFEMQSNYEIELYNSQGKLIERQRVIGESMQIDLPSQKDVYFVRIVANGMVVKTGKFIR